MRNAGEKTFLQVMDEYNVRNMLISIKQDFIRRIIKFIKYLPLGIVGIWLLTYFVPFTHWVPMVYIFLLLSVLVLYIFVIILTDLVIALIDIVKDNAKQR